MICEVTTSENLMKTAMDLTIKLSNMPTKALGLTKKALNYAMENTLEKQLEMELELQTTAAGTDDFREGVQAFVEKRAPTVPAGAAASIVPAAQDKFEGMYADADVLIFVEHMRTQGDA